MDAGRGAGNGDSEVAPLQARLAAMVAENIELRAEIEQLKADRKRMADIQIRLMEVLNCKSADCLVHDVRNVLNERDLYRALADSSL
jgi:regulator of replication initiation timing